MKYFSRIILVLSIVLASSTVSGQHGWTVNPADYEFDGQVTAIVFLGAAEVTTGTLGAFVGGVCRGFGDGAFFPPTSKTVFSFLCYSNVASGETLTFKYYNPADNSICDVNETVAFVSNMTEGNALIPLQFHAVSVTPTFTQLGPYCEGATPDVLPLTSTDGITGTWSPSTISTTSAGMTDYTFTPTLGQCATTTTMTIIVNPIPAAAGAITGATGVCQGANGVTYSVPSITNATSYTWAYSGTGATIDGSSNAVTISFDATATSGNLTVYGVNACGNGTLSANYPVTVNANLPVSVSIAAVPSGAVCTGTSVTYTATPTNGGTTPSYQWQVNGANVGTSLTTYSYTPVNGDVVRCILTSNAPCATGSPATSNSITMAVNANLPVSVSIAAVPSGAVCTGTSVTYTATPTNGGTTPSYQWQVNGANVGTSLTTYSYTPVNGDVVRCILTSNAPCATGSPATSNSITMAVNANLPVSVSIAAVPSGAVCTGTSVTYTATPTNGGTTPSYQWQVNGANVGTSLTTYSYTPVNGDVVRCILTSNAPCATGSPATSNSITMAVNANLPVSVSIAAVPSGAVCTGTSVTYTATPTNGGTTPSYQWQVNGANVGTSLTTYSYTPVNGDVVRCILTSNAPCATGSPATSNSITMAVNANLPVSVSIAAVPSGAVCTGTSVTYTATPTNGGTTPSYQWQVNGANVGTSLTTYSYTPVNGDVVRCILTSNAPCATGSPATSNSITMAVNANLPVSVSIAAVPSGAVCTGTSVTYTATPTNGGTTPSYQWQVNGANVGTSLTTYSYTPVNGDVVRCILTSNAPCATGSPATSNSITMAVNANLPVSVSIAAVPSGAVCTGTSVTYTATPTNGGTTPSYQWQVNGANVGTSLTTYSYTPVNGDVVRCILTSNAPCATGSPATSNSITMAVNANLPVSVSIAAVPSGAVCTGTSVTYTATPTNGGTTPSYQWQVNGANVGTSLTTYSYTPVNGDVVRCILTSNAPCATGSPATSNSITMAVNANLPVSVSIAAVPSGAVCTGTSVTYTATPTNGGTTPSYQWQVNGANVGTSLTTYSYTPVNGDVVRCILTSNAPCATGSPATSNSITMAVNANLPVSVSIAAVPSGAVCTGTSVTYTATPTNGGTTPSYQWQVNGANVGTSLTTYSYTPVNGDVVRCILTSNAPCATGSPATSNSITMAVNANLPVSVSIAAVPSGAVCTGTSVTYTATPTNGGTTPSYQWQVNGANVGTSLTTYSYTPVNGDVVRCILTSNAPCATGSPATSNSITMAVNANLPVSVSIAAVPSGAVCTGTSVTYTATPTNGGTTPSYQWQVNGANVGTSLTTYSYTPVNGDVVRCILTSNAPCATGSPATSNSITMAVNANLPVSVSIAAVPSGAVCTGTSVTYTATPTNGGTTPSYQWQVNGANVGTSLTTYSYTPVNGDVVRCILTSNAPCATGSPATSNSITMAVNANLPVSVSIAAVPSGAVCTGTSVTYTATPTNGGTTPSYQWQVNGANVGTSLTTYSYTPVNGDVVRCILTSNAPCATGSPATSNSITMAVNANLPVSVSIAAVPSGAVCTGTSVTYTATPTNGGTTPSYQWQVNGANVGTSLTTYSYTPVNGDVVRCILTSNAPCATGSPATSNSITMAVNANLPVSVSIAAVPSGAVCTGTSVTYTATPTNGGTTPSYQWQVNGANVGTSLTTYSYTPVNGDVVRCILTSNAPCATGSPATSNSITMAVNANLPVSVSIAAVPSGAVCTGTSVTYTATPTNGGTTPSYQWQVNGANVGTSLTTYSYTPVNGDVVRCILTSNAPCATGSPATSNSITMAVNANLPVSVSIAAVPSGAVCTGTSVTYTATPTNGGTTPSYQWQVNGANVGTSLTTYSYTPVNGDVVRCILTSNAPCATGSPATSNSITMAVNPLPAAAGAITGTTAVCQGASGVTYSVPSITNATSYTWAYSGTGASIIGSTNSIMINFTATATSGILTVRGVNTCGSGTVSTNYPITVNTCTKTLNLTSVFLEGLYNGGGTMRQAYDEFGPHWPSGVADHINVELHSSTGYSTIIYTATEVELSTSGTATITIPAGYSASYYITVRHRNHIETTTALPVSFINATITYALDAPAKAFGSNLKLIDETVDHFVIYGADINQDGFVDSGDYPDVVNDNFNYVTGYLPTDINGDGFIDSGDYPIMVNNNYNYVSVVLP